EDGIRDGHVTGVQTCALPISVTSESPPTPPFMSAATAKSASWSAGSFPPASRAASPDAGYGLWRLYERFRFQSVKFDRVIAVPRSEERRVGKESRLRWAR